MLVNVEGHDFVWDNVSKRLGNHRYEEDELDWNEGIWVESKSDCVSSGDCFGPSKEKRWIQEYTLK